MDSKLPRVVSSPIQTYLEHLHRKYAPLREGEVASYIPELTKANPEWFGICLATTDGCVYEVGDTRQVFTIQSVSKPLTYGLALEDCGRERVLAKIGVEPTGDAFNSISLTPGTGAPKNPMINAGAIAAASLVAGASPGERLERLLATYSRYAGRPLTLDESVYHSESETGHRNRAIGHMLRNFDIIGDDPEPALQLYFQQCSVAVTCRDLSLAAATLANGGVNPVTGERAVCEQYIDSILSVMTTCGMYDYTGEWVYRIGMPAKSGVGGGIMAVLPGQLGIAVFSPRLDARGNSVRGVKACEEISHRFNLHSLRVPPASLLPIRAEYDVATISSKRQRTEAERAVLAEVGARAMVYELQGEVGFPAAEHVVRTLVDGSPTHDITILDLRRVARIEEAVVSLFAELARSLTGAGKSMVFADVKHHGAFITDLNCMLEPAETVAAFEELDRALEWAENLLLAACDRPVDPLDRVSLAEHAAFAGVQPADLEDLHGLLSLHTFAPGATIIRKGDRADIIYFLTRGAVSITITLPGGNIKRLSTLAPGMMFGELAIIDRTDRSADVCADTAVECYALALADFDALDQTHPALKSILLQNMLRTLSQTVRRLSNEVRALAA